MGPETVFTIAKRLTKWSPSGHIVFTEELWKGVVFVNF